MLKFIVVVVVLAQLFSSGNSFNGLTRQIRIRQVSQSRSFILASGTTSEDLSELSLVELKTKLRTSGLPVSGSKKELIERLTTAAEPQSTIIKTTKKLSGLLRRRSAVKVIPSDDEHEEIPELKEKEVVLVQEEVVAIAKQPAIKAVKQWESRKELVEKTPTVAIKKIDVVPVAPAVVPVAAEQVQTKKDTVPALQSKKPIKSVKQVVAAYDIDDDDFMDQFMDAPAQGQGQGQERSAPEQRLSSIPSSSPRQSDDASSSEDSSRAAWPGPGVPWMSGPLENNASTKRDQNRGRNALMAAADDDLQRMVDQRNDARYRRDYDGADAIREELRTIYRVEIYDKLGEWVAADGRWGLSNRKRGAGATEDGIPVMAKIQGDAKPCTLTYEQIMDMVVQRTNARRTRQFQVADDIRDELARVGVELFDKVNEWRTYDGQMRGTQSEDFEKYEVKKDNERYDRGNSRDNAW